MSLVSVLIPSHNAALWIAQAIGSALAQTAAVEVIVIDDGSTDGTVEIIRSFGDRIRWETGPNRGAPAARNRALELASGEWVQYLDADDYLMPHKIADQLAALQTLPETDVIYGPETVEWREGGEVRTTVLPIDPPHDPWYLLALWRLPQTGAPLWRRAALLDIGGWREDQPCCQEHELYLRLLIAGKRFTYHSSGGAVYRRFATGTLSTKDLPRARAERMKIERRLEEHLDAKGELSDQRQWAIDQARFNMARSAWPVDRAEAQRLHDAISSRHFRPVGLAAPRVYRLAYRLVGFERSEILAKVFRMSRT